MNTDLEIGCLKPKRVLAGIDRGVILRRIEEGVIKKSAAGRIRRCKRIFEAIAGSSEPINAKELAERLGVSRKTINREIWWMRNDLKLPLYFNYDELTYYYDQTNGGRQS